MAVLWLDEIGADDLESVGGKAASLGELTAAGLPVPPGFVVTAGTYRTFIEEAGIDEELFEVGDIDTEDSKALAEAQARAQELILETEMPEELREEILAAYEQIGDGDAFVAVRSSATAEDLPDASFAGQQETYLNITAEDLLDHVKRCWASLFTQRSIYYRQEQGFAHDIVNIAVVVQQMVAAEKSGVMFTSHPSTGENKIIIESAWGLGEGVVSGSVTPDNYIVDRETGEVTDVEIATKKTMYAKDDETGETLEREVPENKRTERVLSEAEINRLVALGEEVENHYNTPQDVEWAIYDGDVYMLQSRPITTIAEESDEEAATADGSGAAAVQESEEVEGDISLSGLGASPGTVSGMVRIVDDLDELDKVGEGDIIVAEMTTPDMVPAMKRAAGIVTDEGGMTSHAAIVSRELGVPAVVGVGNATDTLTDGQTITIDGEKGTITEGTTGDQTQEQEAVKEAPPTAPVQSMTGTEVRVNVSVPEAAERAAATGADGVGLLRLEQTILSTNKTPERYIEDHGEDAYTEKIVEGIRPVAEEFYPRPVTVRTPDISSDEYRELQGGEGMTEEHNPLLGYRGIRRSLDRPDVFKRELEAFARLYEAGYDNVEIMLPLVNDAEDVLRAKELIEEAGIETKERTWGVMIETPASVRSIEEIVDAGVDFASLGTNDLTQYTLAVDRNNEKVADRFDELHPAVLDQISDTIEVCDERGVDTSICSQAGSKPRMIRHLVNEGITAISVNVDAVHDVQREVDRVEKKRILDSVR